MTPELDAVDALAQVSSRVQGMLERRAGEQGISTIQARLLGILRDRTPTMNELAQLLGLDKSSTSGLVDRAQRRGLVRRVPSQLDRRSVRVRLSDQGRELTQAVDARFDDDLETLIGPLSGDERGQLSALLSRVLAADGASGGSGSAE